MNIDELLNEKEGKNIEFKRAKSEFDFLSLLREQSFVEMLICFR